MANTKNGLDSGLQKRSLFMFVTLIVQYLFGMYINMFAVPPDDPKFKTEPIYPKIVFGLHGLLGTMLLIGSIIVLVSGLKNQDLKIKKIAVFGFFSILLAFCGGIATISFKDNAAEISSYIMSIGFLLSFIFYFKLTFYLKNKS